MRLALALLAALALQAQTEAQIRRAAIRALKPIERSIDTFITKRACISCHHNSLAVVALRTAYQHGINVDSKLMGRLEAKTFVDFIKPDSYFAATEARDFSDPTPNDSFLLWAADVAGSIGGRDMAERATLSRIARWQQPDGHWATSDFRPPHSSSLFTATASALLAGASSDLGTDSGKAKNWLVSHRPESTEDASFRLIGIVLAQGSEQEIDQAAADLAALQRPNGGWPQLPGYVPDAYSTGEAVYALQRARRLDRARQRGLRFLVVSQLPSGAWFTKSRMLSPAKVSPDYFKTGFPIAGRDEFLSFTGSAWALIALSNAMEAVPDRQVKKGLGGILTGGYAPGDLAGSASSEEWTKAALAKGADARTARGTLALTIAASYRGNSATLRALLDAGAEPNPPAEANSRHTPLVLAASSGDLEAIQLLLSRGADPNLASRTNSPISAAITFGHPEVLQALIDKRADTKLVDGTGVNLLHWATITNRWQCIAILAKAGVPLNEVDDNGYTPLHYAASVDHGDTRTLDALLAAGANPKERDFNNRTPLQVAQRHGHKRLAARLRQR